MNPTVALATYDVHGMVLQLSTGLDSGIQPADVVGTSVHDWGNAAQHVAAALFTKADYHVGDITWESHGISGITRVCSIKLESTAAVAVCSHRYRTWILTETELNVIQCISHGYTITEAAEQLLLSVDAVKSALVRVRSKTGARGTAHAVAICCRAGVI